VKTSPRGKNSTNGDNKKQGPTYRKRLAAAEAAAIREAEQAVTAMAETHLRKRTSEIMISSENEDEPEAQLSFMKYLSPKSAALVKKSFETLKISAQAKKNLKIA